MSAYLDSLVPSGLGGGGTFDGGGASGDWETPTDAQKIKEMTQKAADDGKLKEFTAPTATSNAKNVISTLNKTSAPAPSTQSSEGQSQKKTGDFIVRIKSRINQGDVVEFNVSPTIAESRGVSYASTDLLHHPGQMQVYRSTAARHWSIAGMFVSRTAEEAQRNLNYINLLRSWSMPYFGTGTEADEKTNQSHTSTGGVSGSRFGAPPDTLMLSAYGETMIGPVACVLTNSSWTWPNEVQYIQAANGNPFPVSLQITVELTESYSAVEYSSFSLASYKAGNLDTAFNVKG